MKEIKFNRTDFIATYTEAYTKEICKELRDYIDLLEERAFLTDEFKKVNKNVEHRSQNLSHHYDLPSWSWIAKAIFPSIQTCVNHYLSEFAALGSNKFLFTDFKVKKIPEGGGFHSWHFEDNGLKYSTRYLAVQIYLNDNFEGGETEFLYFNKRVKPIEGSITIFPCAFTHTHRGNPPIGGDKYLATSWGIIQDSTNSY
tara:strand:- start:60 stop:656 length:597 start_codon:yes stop_codon:yes gene_type:complete